MGWLKEDAHDEQVAEVARQAERMRTMSDKLFVEALDEAVLLGKYTKEQRGKFLEDNSRYIGMGKTFLKARQAMNDARRESKGSETDKQAQELIVMALFAKKLVENADKIKEF